MSMHEEYLQNASICPHCGSSDLIATPVDIEGDRGISEVFCNDCHAKWNDIYTLTAVEFLEGE